MNPLYEAIIYYIQKSIFLNVHIKEVSILPRILSVYIKEGSPFTETLGCP